MYIALVMMFNLTDFVLRGLVLTYTFIINVYIYTSRNLFSCLGAAFCCSSQALIVNSN